MVNIFHNNFTLFLQSIAMSSRVVQGHSRGMNLENDEKFQYDVVGGIAEFNLCSKHRILLYSWGGRD